MNYSDFFINECEVILEIQRLITVTFFVGLENLMDEVATSAAFAAMLVDDLLFFTS